MLGNIRIGDGAKLGCGAVVLRPIPSGATAVGAPAKIIGRAKEANPAAEGDHALQNVQGFDGACVWREIARRAGQPDGTASKGAGVLSFPTFKTMLGKEGVPDDAIGELFFAMDMNNDGIVTEKEFADNFSAIGARLCRAMSLCGDCSLQCPKRRETMKQDVIAHMSRRMVPKVSMSISDS